MAIGRRGTPTSAFDTAGTTNHAAVSVPSGVVDGDLLIMVIAADNATITGPGPTITLNGWTSLDRQVFGTYTTFQIFYRVASSEPASYGYTTDVSGKSIAMMEAYSGVDTSSPFGTAHAIAAQSGSSATHTTPSINPRNITDWVISAFVDRSTTVGAKNTDWTPTSPAVERLEANNNSNTNASWRNIALNDENGQVGSTSAKTHTDVSTISQANAAMWIGSLQQASTGVEYTDSATIGSVTSPTSDEVFTPFAPKTTSVARLQLGATATPAAGDAFLNIQARKANPTDGGVLRVWLYEGATIREGPYDITLTDSFALDQHTLTDPTTITDWSNLEIRIQGVSTNGSTNLTPEVSWIDLASPSTGAQVYIDAGTIDGITTLFGAVEIAEFVDADTLTTSTAPSSVEVHEIPDSATIASVTELSSTEVTEYVDADTVSGVTTFSGEELYTPYAGTEYTDTATIAGVTDLSSIEVVEYVDADTVTNTTTPTAVEVSEYVDAATIPSSTTPSTSEIAELTDEATISGTTTPQATTEVAEFVDAYTIGSVTDASAVEVTEYVDANTVAGITTPSGEEIFATTKETTTYRTRITSLLPPNPTTPQTLYIRARKANPADSGVLRVIVYETGVQRETYDITLTDSFATDNHELVNAGDITDWTDIEIAFKGVADTGSDLTVQVSWVEFEIPESSAVQYSDANTITGSTSLSAEEIVEFVDASTLAGETALSSEELIVATDGDVVGSVTSPSTTDIAAYVEQAEIAGSTTPSSVEVIEAVEAETVTSTTSLSGVEVAEFVDAATLAGTTEISTIEIVAYDDGLTITTVTTFTGEEYTSGQSSDAGTISTISTISAIEVAAFVDSNTVNSTTSLSAVEGKEYVDTAIITNTTTPSSVDVAAYIDSDSTTSITTISGVEITQFVDAVTLENTTTLSGTDLAIFLDTSTTSTTTSLGTVEVTTFADTNTTITSTQPAGTDEYIPAAAYVDSATISGASTLTHTDLYASTDSNTIIGSTGATFAETLTALDSDTISSVTLPYYTEILEVTDAATIGIITSPYGTDIYFTLYGQTATIPTITTLGSVEAQYIVDLVGYTYHKWIVSYGTHWIGKTHKHYSAGLGLRDIDGYMIGKWATWKN